MHQLISRQAVYFIVGIGVFLLLVSQFRSSENRASTSVSELDPFGALEDLSSENLITSTPNWQEPASVDMVRDQMTAANSYQQTAAAPLDDESAVASLVLPQSDRDHSIAPTPQTTPQLADVDMHGPQISGVNQIDIADDSLTALPLDEPIVLDDTLSNEKYHLEEVHAESSETDIPSIDSLAVNDEIKDKALPTRPSEESEAQTAQVNNLLQRRWRKNPFLGEDIPSDEPLKLQTSEGVGNGTSLDLNRGDAPNVDTAVSTEVNQNEQFQAVGNFEKENMASVVTAIPTTEQPLQSIVSNGRELNQQRASANSLPIVVGLPDSVSHKAVHSIEYGKSLSRRGSAFAARQEFYSALRILAQAHDTQAGGNGYTKALRDAIIALKEAEQFIVADTETQIGLDVASVIEGHSTKLIPLNEAADLTAIGAMQRYFGFASSQLQVATGQNAVAAEALYCLGKLHTVQAKFGANDSKLDIAKAIVFHQAAIASDSSNFRSANELGVLMANSGRLKESQEMLKRSLQIQQLPQAWQNLAVIHQRSGETHLAQLAQREFLNTSRQASAGVMQDTIRWINPEKFNQGTPLELRQGQGAEQPLRTQQPAAQQNTNKPTISQRLKSLF